MIPLVYKPYVNEVTLNQQNLYSKSCQSSELKLCMLRRLRSFQRGTVGLCRSTGCKVTSCQSWKFEKNSATQPTPDYRGSTWAGGRIFCQTSNFDSLYLCSKLTYRDSQYLFGKIATSLTCIVSIQSSSRILNTGFAHLK